MVKLSNPFQGHVLQLIEFPGSKPQSPSKGYRSLSTSKRRISNMCFQVSAVLGVDRSFLLTSADKGLIKDIFFYPSDKVSFIPSF